MKTLKNINNYAEYLVDNYGKSLIENNLEITLPKIFTNLNDKEKVKYLLKNHRDDIEEDMGYYNENV